MQKVAVFAVNLPYTNEQMLHFARRCEIHNSIPKAPQARWRDAEERKVKSEAELEGLLVVGEPGRFDCELH